MDPATALVTKLEIAVLDARKAGGLLRRAREIEPCDPSLYATQLMLTATAEVLEAKIGKSPEECSRLARGVFAGLHTELERLFPELARRRPGHESS